MKLYCAIKKLSNYKLCSAILQILFHLCSSARGWMEVDILMADFISPVLWRRFQTRNREAMVGRPIRVTRRYILQSLSRILWEIKITQLLEDFGHYSVVEKKVQCMRGQLKNSLIIHNKVPMSFKRFKIFTKSFLICNNSMHNETAYWFVSGKTTVLWENLTSFIHFKVLEKPYNFLTFLSNYFSCYLR